MSIRMRHGLFVLPIALVVLATSTAQARPTHDIEPDDYFTIGTVIECAVSPDGHNIAYTEMRWGEMKERRTTDLWVVNVKTKERTRLTFERTGAHDLNWSPDSKQIYFLGRYDKPGHDKAPYNGKTQLYRIHYRGGDASPVTRVKNGVGLYDLSEDGKTLYFTKSKEKVEGDFKDLKEQYAELEYGHGVVDYDQVWTLDLEGWKEKKLIDEDRVIRDLAVSPDGKRIAMITTPDGTLLTNEGWSRIDVYHVDKGNIEIVTPEKWRSRHPSPYGWVEQLAWSSDSGSLSFTISYDGYPSELYVAEWIRALATVRKISRPDGIMLGMARPVWRNDSLDLYFLGEEKARVRLYRLRDVAKKRQGRVDCLTPGDVVLTNFSINDSGQVAFVMSTPTHMRDIFTLGMNNATTRITKVNPQAEEWKFPQIKVVSWKGANGDTVEGILELPYDYKEGDGPLPMVVEIHGGPTAATYLRIRFWIYGRVLMPAKGYALLSPNYRGSTGYGDQFLTDLIGRENDIEVTDILTGIEAMIDRGIADPQRIGVMGWSNGGFLTNALITRDVPIKAASSGAGVLDMMLQWGIEDTPGHVVNYMEGLPWEKPDAYRKGSPVYDLDKCKVPTLIHVGGSDPRVPPAHSRALYRALRHYLNVPVELVVYPGEGHGLTTRENRKAKMEWDLAWFDKYLLGKEE